MKLSIDRMMKICSACQKRFFKLDGKGSLFRPLVHARYLKTEDGKRYIAVDPTKSYPAKYFCFGEDEFENAEECLKELGMRCKHKGLCNYSNFVFTNDKYISVKRKNLFYKALSKVVKKGHIKVEIEHDCPYFMEISLMKDNAKQEFKNIILKKGL